MKKLPSEVLEMEFDDALELLDYWAEFPPEHEVLSMLARVYTTWSPESKPMTEEEKIAAEERIRIEHRRSLEQRWNAGSMSAKDLVNMGGVIAK